jgi:hypothetical protein
MAKLRKRTGNIPVRPIKLLAETTVDLLASVTSRTHIEPLQRLLPFVIYTPENL